MSTPTNSPSASQMVGIYSKLFGLLAGITLLGIAAVYFFHFPVWLVITLGLILIVIKSSIVIESFKQFMVGRNLIVMVFALTGIFVLGLLLLPVFNHSNVLIGTQDLSKEIQMENTKHADTPHADAAHEEPAHGH